MYEESVRVPMVFWSKSRFSSGLSVDNPVQLFDIGPTVMELAGIETPESWEARSLVPFLNGDNAVSHRKYVFSEHARDTYLPTIEFMTMIRDSRFKLVHFAGETQGQLFDLQNDPNEFHDLWNDPAWASQKRESLDALHEWLFSSIVQAHNWSQDWR